MRNLLLYILLFSGISFISHGISFSQETRKVVTGTLEWVNDVDMHPRHAIANGLFFDGEIPMAVELVDWAPGRKVTSIEIIPEVTEEVSNQYAISWFNERQIASMESDTEVIGAKGKSFLRVVFPPYIIKDGTVRRILAYTIYIGYTQEESTAWMELVAKGQQNYASTSVLATGRWFKLATMSDGIFRLTYNDLSNMGIGVNSIDPRKIQLYGNGGGMLPEGNANPRYDDLYQNAIYVHGEDDGSFDPGDYVLFIGQSPHRWEYKQSEDAYHHSLNLYSDKTYYFLTVGNEDGRRIGTVSTAAAPPTQVVEFFDDYDFYEAESYNLIKSGKDWYGEKFDVLDYYDLPDFSFPNHDIFQDIYVRAAVAAKSTSLSNFGIILDGVQVLNPIVAAVPAQSYNTDYAKRATESRSMLLTSSDFDLEANYNPAAPNSVGWLDFVEVNVRRSLSFVGSQMIFRDKESKGSGNVSEFKIENSPSGLRVWEITSPLDPAEVPVNVQSGNASFAVETDMLREFIAFDGSSYKTAEIIGEIENQNLHSFGPADMIIVSHPDFLEQASRLGQLHNEQDNYSVLIVTPQEIYNEFSSGAQDPVAIRDFIRMVYSRNDENSELRFVLLFGDGSYDPKNRMPDNTNFIPTFQSKNSLQPTASYATDDFFVLMDDSEGAGANGTPDIGIGRFPVQTYEEAKTAIDKIENYTTNGLSAGAADVNQVPALADWRNMLTFVADDQDGNLHLNQAEDLVDYIQSKNRDYNVDKIYLDAYEQVSTPGGQRYPAVNAAINDRVTKGTLIVNYTGHGGETGLAQERVLEIQDINSWDNKYNMPVFVTATCEFSRFDDPARVSAGELAFLSPNGGAIALFTTTRLSFSSSNFALNLNFYDKVFDKIDGEYPKMGDVIRLAKTPSNPNIRNFVLLGDPALRLAYPEHKVYTTRINGRPIDGTADTLNALSKVTIEGIVATQDGDVINDFNGIIYPSVYDKPAEILTRGNDNDSSPKRFFLQKNLLYKGKASVVNGEFSFTFVVPRDIAYRLDYGRISYYATDGETDAGGFYENIKIGGSNPDAPEDETGPELSLFMNDTNFVMHGITDENPVMLAFVNDSNGVNTVGNGIGHDIVAILDGNTDEAIVLNDYYEADLDKYQSGTIQYPFHDLEEGLHTLELKVWDVYNNSATAYIEFVVASSGEMTLSSLYNYPNPFMDQTHFVFEHNQPGRDLDIDLSIFSLDGRLVHQIKKQVTTNGYRTNPIPWDGRSGNGSPLPAGFYVYRVRVDAGEGFSNEMSEKLLIVR